MHAEKPSLSYRFIRFFIQLFYPRTEVIGAENLPDEPVIVVGNHAQIHGPIACGLYFPGKSYTWCAGQMMHLKEVPDYAFQDFWSRKPRWCRWFYRLLSYLIAPVAACVFNCAYTIPVYKDARLRTTFKMSMDKLQEGASMIIFPEYDQPCNNILYDFQDKFIDLARLYHRRTGKELRFVPLYLAPALKKMYIGTPTRFCADRPIAEERARIREYLMTEITDMARALPEHAVVPYRNIPRKFYPSNIPQEAMTNEETRC